VKCNYALPLLPHQTTGNGPF